MAIQYPQASGQEPRREIPKSDQNSDEQAQPWHGPSPKPAVRPRPAKERPVFRDWASI
jgi:hypothetical protein